MEEDNNSKTSSKDSKSKGRFKLWQKILAWAVVIFVVLFIVINLATSGVVKVSNEFLKDMQNKNADGAYSLLTKDAAAATDKDQFTKVVDQVGPILNTKAKMTSKEASGETGKAGTGKVVYEIKGTNGVTYNVTVNLQKEDGNWKVLNFESTQKK